MLAAPVHVADVLGHLDHSELLAVGREDPHALGACDVHVASFVELHPVDELTARQVPRADSLGEDATVRESVVGADVEDSDVRVHRVVDVQLRFVGREAEAVRLGEVVDQELQVATIGRKAVHALEVELLLTLEPEPSHSSVRRIGEDDRAVDCHDHVIRAVQFTLAPVGGECLARSVGRLAHEGARDVLADDQVPMIVARHPVALVAGVAQHRDALGGMPAAALVTWHVAEMERSVGHPDRPLREREPRCDLLDLGVLIDQLTHPVGLNRNRHSCSFASM